jgi:membrane-associated phospholipid phosphatase
LSRSFLSLSAVRFVLVVLGLAAWFGTQSLIGSRVYTEGIGDGVLDLLAPAHDYLFTHVGARDGLLIASSGVIDLLGIFLLGQAIFGKSLRPFVGLLILFALRQICQAVCVLPMPPEMIWPKEGPGFPSLLVTYGVGNDLFFSGHTALAVFGATELGRLRKWLIPVGVGIALFEMVAVLMLRAHWSMDVYAGAVTALLVACIAGPVSKPIDRALARLTGRNSNDEGRMTNQI